MVCSKGKDQEKATGILHKAVVRLVIPEASCGEARFEFVTINILVSTKVRQGVILIAEFHIDHAIEHIGVGRKEHEDIYDLQCTIYNLRFTMYNLPCTIYNLQFTIGRIKRKGCS